MSPKDTPEQLKDAPEHTESVLDSIPETVALSIELKKGHKDRPFYVGSKNFDTIKPYLTALNQVVSPVYYTPEYDTRGNMTGTYFGSTDVEVNRKIDDIFGISELLGLSDFEEEYSESAQRTKKVTDYAWDELKHIGDHFLAIGADPRNISVHAHHKSIEMDRIFRCHKVRDGVLVVLIDGKDLIPAIIVEKKNG